MGVYEYSVLIHTCIGLQYAEERAIILAPHMRHVYTVIRTVVIWKAARKKKKKVCHFLIRSHDLLIRSTLLQSNAPLFGPSVGVLSIVYLYLGIIWGIHRESDYTPGAWFANLARV